MPSKRTINWLFNDIYDVIYSLLVLIEKLTFFKKQLNRFIISLSTLFLSECFTQKDVYSELRQKSKVELFTKIVHAFRQLTIFVKSFILDVGLSSKHPSADSNSLLIFSKNEQLTNLLIQLQLTPF